MYSFTARLNVTNELWVAGGMDKATKNNEYPGVSGFTRRARKESTTQNNEQEISHIYPLYCISGCAV
jgi:hypothetical protein